MNKLQANSASGIAVADECKATFLELKAKRNHRFVTFKIDDSVQQITVDQIGNHGDTYEDFINTLPEADCRYAVFDYDFTTDENCHKSKIFFIAWYLNVLACFNFILLHFLVQITSTFSCNACKQVP